MAGYLDQRARINKANRTIRPPAKPTMAAMPRGSMSENIIHFRLTGNLPLAKESSGEFVLKALRGHPIVSENGQDFLGCVR